MTKEEEFKMLNEEGVKLKLNSVLDYFSKEGETFYTTTEAAPALPAKIKEIKNYFNIISDIKLYCLVEVSSYSQILYSIKKIILQILKKNMYKKINIEVTKTLILYLFQPRPYISRTISEESREYFTKIEKEKPRLCQYFLRSSNHPNAIENFLFSLTHLGRDNLPIVIEIFNFYKLNKDNINLRVKCYIFDIFNAFINFNNETRETWSQELSEYCIKELEEKYEKARQLQIPIEEGMNNFICTKRFKIPLDESTEDDCLRLFLKYCFCFVHVLTFFQKEQDVILFMFYANNVTDSFIRNEVLTNLTCYKNQRKNGEKYRVTRRTLQLCIDNGLLDILSWYLETFKFIDNDQNPPSITCFEITNFHLRDKEQAKFEKLEVMDSLEYLTIQMITNFKSLFGNLLNLFQKLPNIDLFIRKSILEGTGIVRVVDDRSSHVHLLSREGMCGLRQRNETSYEDILKRLVSGCLEDDAVLNELLLTPKYNFLYLLIQSLGDYSGFYPSQYDFKTRAMSVPERNEEIRCLHRCGIGKLIQKFGFEKALKCVPSFPLLLEAKGKDDNNKRTPIFDFLVDFIQKNQRSREEKCKFISFFMACGIRLPNKLQNGVVDEVIERKIKEINVLLYLASAYTIPRLKNKNRLNSDFLHILKEMLNEDIIM